MVSCGEDAAVHLCPDAALTFIDSTEFYAVESRIDNIVGGHKVEMYALLLSI